MADTGALCGNEIVASGVRTADAIEKELLVEVSNSLLAINGHFVF